MLYVLAITLLAAAVVGVVPALKATGRHVQGHLQRLSAGGGSGMQLGRTWTLLIVGQVACAVALLAPAVYFAWDAVRARAANYGIAPAETLTANVRLDAGTANDTDKFSVPFRTRYSQRQSELLSRLTSEGVLADATFAAALPGTEGAAFIEIERVAAPDVPADYRLIEGTALGHLARFNRVAPNFFDAFDVPLHSGRRFRAADTAPAANVVLVNRTFAERFSGGHVLGRRVRHVGRSGDAGPDDFVLGQWHEIVGVVADYPAQSSAVLPSAVLYHPATADELYPPVLALRMRGGDPRSFAGRLREIAAEVDPNLQLVDIASMEERLGREDALRRLVAGTLGGITLSVLALSAAGIYALMSFTVERRRKEIGIRAALGADPVRILRSVFSRAAGQLATGAMLGLGLAVAVEHASGGELIGGRAMWVLPTVAAIMATVGLAATWVPARRGLNISPTEALRQP